MTLWTVYWIGFWISFVFFMFAFLSNWTKEPDFKPLSGLATAIGCSAILSSGWWFIILLAILSLFFMNEETRL